MQMAASEQGEAAAGESPKQETKSGTTEETTTTPATQTELRPLRRDGLEGACRLRGIEVRCERRAPIVHKIAHIGVGNFHRSHMAYVMDKVLDIESEPAWGIIGVSLSAKPSNFVPLDRQDFLYTLAMEDDDLGAKRRVIESIVDYLVVARDTRSLDALRDVKIVSLTVTEKGYSQKPGGELDLKAPRIASDVAGWKWAGAEDTGLTQPKSAFGLICTLLARRWLSQRSAFTVMSCDNMPHNGRVCRRSTLAFAQAVACAETDAAKCSLAPWVEWIEEEVTFPNSMVDRITPAVDSAEDRDRLNEASGFDDAAPVKSERFLQWVLEDDFVDGRPKWELAFSTSSDESSPSGVRSSKSDDIESVMVTRDVAPYEMMKLRLLNGSHSCLSYPALLVGHRVVDVAVRDDPMIQKFLERYFREVFPTLPRVPGVDVNAYRATLLRRFKNSKTSDSLDRLAADGTAKFNSTLRHPLEELKATRASLPAIAFAVAAFARALADPTDDDGRPFAPPEKGLRAELRDAIDSCLPQCATHSPGECKQTRRFIALIFGEDVADFSLFVKQVHNWRHEIHAHGTRAALKTLVMRKPCTKMGLFHPWLA